MSLYIMTLNMTWMELLGWTEEDVYETYPFLRDVFWYRNGPMASVCYSAIFLCLIGVIVNIISGIVLTRKEMKSCSNYILLGLTCFDIIVLLTFAVSYGISLTFTPSFSNVSNVEVIRIIYLRIIYQLNRTAYTGSVYSTILITLERYYVVKWPLKARRFLTVKRASYAIGFVLLFSTVINISRWLEFIVVDKELLVNIYWDRTLAQNKTYIWCYEYIFWTIVMYVVPFFVIGVTNFLIWKQLREMTRHRGEMRTTANPEGNALTKMLLTVVSVFFFLNFLNCVGIINGIIIMGAKFAEPETIANLPIIINSSVNFIIYCVLGQQFRKQLVKLMKSCCPSCFKIDSLDSHELSSARVSKLRNT